MVLLYAGRQVGGEVGEHGVELHDYLVIDLVLPELAVAFVQEAGDCAREVDLGVSGDMVHLLLDRRADLVVVVVGQGAEQLANIEL